jgi:hypothetical protein
MSRCNLPLVNVLIPAGALLCISIAHAQLPVIYPKLLPLPPHSAPQPAEPVLFGDLVATDGRTILVSAANGPAAYIYVRNPSGKKWVYESAVVPNEAVLARVRAVRDNIALVDSFIGADFQPAVFVYHRSQGQWTQTQTITATQPVGDAIGPDYIAIGDWSVDDARGAVLIYSESGAGTYVFDSQLNDDPATVGPGNSLGFNPIADRDTVMAAAPGNQWVSVFFRTGGFWSEQAQLAGSVAATFAFSGDRAFLDGPREFIRHDGTWTAGDVLIHPLDPDNGLFTTAMDGTRLIAAESVGDSAFLWELRDGTWQATAELKQARAQCGFDLRLSIAGTVALVACPTVATAHPVFDGLVRVYELPQ